MSESDETAGQTENRLNRDAGPDDDDDLGTLTIAGVLSVAHGVAIASNTVRNRRELWNVIEKDAERRFQCKLPLFNTGTKSPQTLYAGLLRPVYLRSGIKLTARNYDLGGNCHGGGTNVVGSAYPFSPLDIVDVVPMIKYSAAHGEGRSGRPSQWCIAPRQSYCDEYPIRRHRLSVHHFVACFNVPDAVQCPGVRRSRQAHVC